MKGGRQTTRTNRRKTRLVRTKPLDRNRLFSRSLMNLLPFNFVDKYDERGREEG